MDTVNTIPIFPSLLSHTKCHDFDEIRQELIDWCYDFRKRHDGVQLSNVGGWQSTSYFDCDKENFLKYRKYISDKIGISIGKFLSEQKCSKYYITNIWANINGPNDYNDLHDHPGADMSGVLWVSSSENSGDFIFENPNCFGQQNLMEKLKDDFKDTLNYHQTIYYKPVDGEMLLFPANLKHCVRQNKSNKDRISIAFNVNII